MERTTEIIEIEERIGKLRKEMNKHEQDGTMSTFLRGLAKGEEEHYGND